MHNGVATRGASWPGFPTLRLPPKWVTRPAGFGGLFYCNLGVSWLATTNIHQLDGTECSELAASGIKLLGPNKPMNKLWSGQLIRILTCNDVQMRAPYATAAHAALQDTVRLVHYHDTQHAVHCRIIACRTVTLAHPFSACLDWNPNGSPGGLGACAGAWCSPHERRFTVLLRRTGSPGLLLSRTLLSR
jgi:hypothetical protein